MEKITAKSFLEYQYVSNPKFSPDGNYIAFISQKADLESNGYRGDIYILKNGQCRKLTGAGDAKS